MRSSWRKVAAIAGTVALMLACGALARPGHPALAASTAVSIVNFAFNPASVTINVGDTVTWTNTGQAMHTASSDTAGQFDTGFLNNGQSGSKTFTAAGTFSYHCNVHPSMKATVVVNAAAAPAAAAPAAAPAAPAAAAPAPAAAPAAPAAAPAAAAPAAASAAPAAAPATAGRLPSSGTGGQIDRNETNRTLFALALGGGMLLAGSMLAWRAAQRRGH